MMNGYKGDEALNSETAYENNLRAHRAGISNSEVIDTYDEWAHKYDEDLCPGIYNGPVIAAQALANSYILQEDREKVNVLDVAAGTGRVGIELKALGFTNIDGLEPSRWMRSRCTERSVYKKLWPDAIGEQPTTIPDDEYDTVVIAGGMGEGHIPVSGLDEMIRILKQSGLLVIVMREEYLETVAEYAEKLEPYLKNKEQEGTLRKEICVGDNHLRKHTVARTVVPNYSFNKNGVILKYLVSKRK